jgi:hypothetical protein
MDRLSAAARLPHLAMRVVPQRPDEAERFTAIGGTEQCRRFGAGVDHIGIILTTWLDLPDSLDAAAELFREAYGCALSLSPGKATVV